MGLQYLLFQIIAATSALYEQENWECGRVSILHTHPPPCPAMASDKLLPIPVHGSPS